MRSRGGLIALALIVALLATGLVPSTATAAEAAAAAPGDRDPSADARSQPPLPSTSAEEALPLADPPGDSANTTGVDRLEERGSNDPLPTNARDLATKRVASRQETSTVYDNGDGTSTALIAARPLNWKDDHGRWHPLDARLEPTDDDRRKNTSAPFVVEIADTTGGSDTFSIADDGWRVAFSLAGARSGKRAVFTETKATHRDVLPGADLETISTNTGIKQNLVLSSPPATNAWRFPLELEGVTARASEDSGVEFVDGAGDVMAIARDGWAYDGRDGLAEPDSRAPVKVRLVEGPSSRPSRCPSTRHG